MSPKDFPQSALSMSNQQYCLKWNNHQVNLLTAFDRLLQSESFTDVTLACEGKSLRAHKVVLSACSSYFETLFDEHPDKSPIIILKDMKFTHISQLVNFMYRGEINVTQDMLSGLLKTAETLKIKGLAEVSGDQNVVNNNFPPVQNPFSQLHTHFRVGASLPTLVPAPGSVLTAALNTPIVAPLAALLNNEGSMNEQRSHFLKRRSIDNEVNEPNCQIVENLPKQIKREENRKDFSNNDTSPNIHTESIIPNSIHGNSNISDVPPLRIVTEQPQKAQSRRNKEKEQPVPLSPPQPILTPIPKELTVNAQQELPDFLKNFSVFRLNDYLGFRTRQQFWEEPAVRRIMEGIKNKEIDMKSAAEILGVSYGTLYGRYREVFGYLKHAWVNTKPGKSPSTTSKERNIWEEARAQDLIHRVLTKELSLTAAAVRLGIDYNTFFAHVTDNGMNHQRVALLTGAMDPESEIFLGTNSGGQDLNICNPESSSEHESSRIDDDDDKEEDDNETSKESRYVGLARNSPYEFTECENDNGEENESIGEAQEGEMAIDAYEDFGSENMNGEDVSSELMEDGEAREVGEGECSDDQNRDMEMKDVVMEEDPSKADMPQLISIEREKVN